MKALYAALKRRSSTGFQGSVLAPCEIKINIKIKSSRQECRLPGELHRSFVGSRPLRVRLRFLRMTGKIKTIGDA